MRALHEEVTVRLHDTDRNNTEHQECYCDRFLFGHLPSGQCPRRTLFLQREARCGLGFQSSVFENAR